MSRPPRLTTVYERGDSTFPILVSASVVCSSVDRLVGLDHVSALVSSFLDFSIFWSLQKASRHVLPYLLRRLAPISASARYVDAQCDRCHALAARNGRRSQMAILDTLFPNQVVSEAVTAAAERGQVSVLSWLYERQAPVCWRADIALVAAKSGVLDAVRFLLNRFPPVDAYVMYQILMTSISRGFEDITNEIWPQYVRMNPAKSAVSELLSCASKRVAQRMLRNDCLAAYTISIDAASLRGDVAFVIWSHLHGSVATTKAMDLAATHGHFSLVLWLHNNRVEGCTTDAMDGAAAHGHFKIVRWLHQNRSEGCTDRAFSVAAFRGRLDIIRWLFRNRSEGFPPTTFDHVCANGHLEMAQWLDERQLGGGSTNAMDWAAAQNHLEVVKWLHGARTEGCTHMAMDTAASNGHLQVVRWLNQQRTEGCTINAMDNAAANGHFAVLRFLDANNLGGFSTAAMDNAAAGGYLDILRWLHTHEHAVGCTTNAMDDAIAHGHHNVVWWLHRNRTEGCTSRGLDAAAMNGDRCILEFFRESHDEQISKTAFRVCVARGDLHTARWIAAHYATAVDMETVTRYARPNGWTDAVVAAAF